MWVRAKEKRQLVAHDAGTLQMTYSVQQTQKWTAFYEPDVIPDLPWRINHRLLNIRLSEREFKELFEEIKFGKDAEFDD